MNRKIITTGDGSKTIHLEDWNEQYHSIHGAIQEARHVYIDSGLKYFIEHHSLATISILEIGFGTGLNAFLTCLEASEQKKPIAYVGIEAYPISKNELDQLNYPELISEGQHALFTKLHETEWEKETTINPYFKLLKRNQFFSEINEVNTYDVIYFDAFGARVQPELWTEAIFKIMINSLKNDGILVTYSVKGSARRALESVGFETEILEGPPGKRHMLRATKKSLNVL